MRELEAGSKVKGRVPGRPERVVRAWVRWWVVRRGRRKVLVQPAPRMRMSRGGGGVGCVVLVIFVLWLRGVDVGGGLRYVILMGFLMGERKVLSAGWGSRNVGNGMHGFYVQR